MAIPTQVTRPLAVNTPLGEDALLLTGFHGVEGISQLFHFTLDVIAEITTPVPFDKLLGQPIVVRLEQSDGSQRLFHGICNRVTQGESDEQFTSYQLEMVPALWLLTRRIKSKIYQHESVPDILKNHVLKDLDVDYEIQGTFHPRDYCVQYRESDFAFASRLMEEEGIYYYFKHTEDGHKLVLANTPSSHADMPVSSEILYRSSANAGNQPEDYIQEWSKTQVLTSGKWTLWDHCFEKTGERFDAERPILDEVSVGGATHKLKVGNNDALEVYDYPGGYAQRFDGVDKGGGEQPAEIEKIFEDNSRTVGIRMQQEAAGAIAIFGRSNCRQMVSGHKFTLLTLPTDLLTKPLLPDGQYVLTLVSHSASCNSDYRSGDWSGLDYSNSFQAIPFTLPFRPARTTPRPVVQGTQTATVVGPPGEEIFTDKYGRVKVQFHWDRDGQFNIDSACWIRVATVWAGQGFGVIHIPRVGQEVIVDFLEGDPDNPIIIGSVYNDVQASHLNLPDQRMIAGFKSNSYPGGGGYNSLLFDDTKDKEMITMHGQKDMVTTIEHDDTLIIHNDRTIKVDGKHTETITKDTKILIEEGPYEHKVAANKATYYVEGDLVETYNSNQTTTVTKNIKTESKAEILITAKDKITLHTGSSKIVMLSDGTISITGTKITVHADEKLKIDGPDVEMTAAKSCKVGCGNQNTVYDTTKTATSGAAINSSAVGMHEITGALVKIN